MLLLCVIFCTLEVIELPSFTDAVTKVIVLRMRELENCVGGALQKLSWTTLAFYKIQYSNFFYLRVEALRKLQM